MLYFFKCRCVSGLLSFIFSLSCPDSLRICQTRQHVPNTYVRYRTKILCVFMSARQLRGNPNPTPSGERGSMTTGAVNTYGVNTCYAYIRHEHMRGVSLWDRANRKPVNRLKASDKQCKKRNKNKGLSPRFINLPAGPGLQRAARSRSSGNTGPCQIKHQVPQMNFEKKKM